MSTATLRRLALAFSAAFAFAAVAAPVASADYTKRELAGGIGSAIASDGSGGHYVGGSFTHWNAEGTGGGFVLGGMTYSGGSPTNSGTLDTAFKMFDGGYTSVRTAISDGSGGWYVGGVFTRYGKTKTNMLAHIKGDGSLDTAFSASIPFSFGSGCGGNGNVVKTLLLDGDTLYVGGRFDSVNGALRADLAAVDATTGAVKAFNANLGKISSSNNCNYTQYGVSALAKSGSSLFVGGAFPSVAGETKAQSLAKVDATTGASDTTFNGATAVLPGTCTASSCNTVLSLAVVGSDLWVGTNYGSGLSVCAPSCQFLTNGLLLVVNPATKAIDITKSGNAQVVGGSGGYGGYGSAAVTSIVPDSSGHVYVGGAFTSVGKSPNQLTRSGVAEYDISAGRYMSAFSVTFTQPSTNQCFGWGGTPTVTQSGAEVTDLVLDGGALYLTGRFQTVGGTDRPGLAAVDSTTGALDTDFAPAALTASYGCGNQDGRGIPAVISKSTDGALFVGGAFDAVGGTEVGGLIHVNADGTRDTGFTANIVARSNPNYSYCNRWCLNGVNKVVKVGDRLYVGGMFDSVNSNTSIKNVAVLNASDGSLASRQIQGTFAKNTTGVTSNKQPTDASISDIEVDGNIVWIAGQFEYTEGSNKSINIVGIDSTTDTKTSFSTYPWTGGSVSGSGGTCYDEYGYAYSCGSSSPTTWPAPPIATITIHGGNVYAASGWVYTGSPAPTGNKGPRNSALTNNQLFAMNAATGSLVSGAFGTGISVCTQSPGSSTCTNDTGQVGVWGITFVGDRLFIGGQFTKVGTTNKTGLAELNPTTGAVVTGFDVSPSYDSTVCSGCVAGIWNMLSDGNSLYLNGTFTQIGGQSRGGIAQIDLADNSVTSFDPLDGSSFNSPVLYLDPTDNRIYSAGIRYYPNETEFPTLGIILEPTIRYTNTPLLQTTFGYMVTLSIRPPAVPSISVPAASSSSNTNTVVFSTAAGNTVECQIDGGAWTTCSSPLDVSGLSDGSHTVAIRQTDSQGRTSNEGSVTWTVDRTAPTTPTATQSSPTLTNGATSSTSAGFTFSVPSDASKVQCQLDGGAWADCTSPKNLTGLADGSHTMKFRSVDAAGNNSGEQSITWGVYSSAPAAPTITGPAGGSTTNTNWVQFNVVDGFTYKCQIDSGAVIDCGSPLDLTSQADGSHTVKVWAVNPLGTQSDPATVTFTRDMTAPSAPSVDNVPANGTSATTASITLSGAGAGETYECQIDGGTWAACTSPVELSGLADGPHSVKIRLKDEAGNTSSVTEAAWFIGTPVSKPVITSPTSDPSNSSTVTFTTDSNTTTTCAIDGAPPVPCTSPLDLSGLGDGEHLLVITATDGDGYTNYTMLDWVIDTTAPDSPGVTGAPADGTTATTASLTLSGAGEGDVYECSVNGGAFATCTSPLELTGLTDGVQTVKVRIKDEAGNAGAETTVLWRIGDEAPTPPAGQTGSATLSGPGSVVVGPLAKRIFNGPNFNINTVWPAGARRVIISNSPVFSRSQSFPVASTAAWNQPVAKAGTFGSRTVYFKYTGDGINTSQVYTATFNWDRAAPFLNMFAKKRALGYAPDAWKVRFKGGDKGGSGLAKVQIWNKKNGMPQKPPVAGATGVGFVGGFKDVVTVPGKYAPQWARVSDKSGNWSRWYMIK